MKQCQGWIDSKQKKFQGLIQKLEYNFLKVEDEENLDLELERNLMFVMEKQDEYMKILKSLHKKLWFSWMMKEVEA